MHHRSTTHGFTLLELLIAIAIFAIIGVLAMSGYNQLVMQRERAQHTMARVRAIQRAMIRITQDLEQLEPRPTRDATASLNLPALSYNTTGATYVLEFTRAGWPNPAGVNRSTLQRVGYRIVDGKLYRDYWTVLDRTLNNVPLPAELLDQVTGFKLRFMDGGHQWQTTWPVSSAGAAANAGAARALPIAVELTLTLKDWGEIKRLIEVPG